jgi:hypothetical protein
MTLWSGVDATKCFSSLTKITNKLEHLSLASFSNLVLYLLVRLGSYPNGSYSTWLGSCRTPKYNTRLENFARDKYSSLFGLVVSYEEKSFTNIDSR